MKIEINFKGEIKDKDLDEVRGLLVKIKALTDWYKLIFNFEELKQK